MSAEPKRYKLDDDTRAKPLIEEARETPVIVEMNGNAYRVSIEDVASAPFTARSAYASLPPLPGGKDLSDAELEDIIRQAGEQHARTIIDEMRNE